MGYRTEATLPIRATAQVFDSGCDFLAAATATNDSTQYHDSVVTAVWLRK